MNNNQKSHDLYDFMKQATENMQSEYERIYRNASNDPSTAGDQGEENWAELLQGWIPSTYKIVTKGRIIGHDGITSPQVDILILKESYPEKLLNKSITSQQVLLGHLNVKIHSKQIILKTLSY